MVIVCPPPRRPLEGDTLVTANAGATGGVGNGAGPARAAVHVTGEEPGARVDGTLGHEARVGDGGAGGIGAVDRFEERREALAREFGERGRPDVVARIGRHAQRPDDALAVFANERGLDEHRDVLRIGEQEERVERDRRGAEGALLALGEGPLRLTGNGAGRGVTLSPWERRRRRVAGRRRAPVHRALRDDRAGRGHADAERSRREAAVEGAAFLVDPDREALPGGQGIGRGVTTWPLSSR